MAKKDEEVGTLDTIIEKYSLRMEICTNKSKHVDRGMNIPSDMMFEHDTMFLVKRIANMEMAINSVKLREWSPKECGNFYTNNNLSSHNFRDTFLADNKSGLKWYFQGRSEHYIKFLEYRWNNDMVFTSYRQRVDKALDMVLGEHVGATTTIISKIRDLEDQRSALAGELNGLQQLDGVSDRLKSILSNVTIDLSDI